MTRTVRDAALMLNAIAGADDRDRFSLPTSHPDYLKAVEGDIRGLRLAWSPNLGFAIVDPQVQQITAEAVTAFAELGCHVEETNPGFDHPGELFQHFFYVNIGAMLHNYPGYESQIDPQLLANLAEVKGVSGQEYARSILRRNTIFEQDSGASSTPTTCCSARQWQYRPSRWASKVRPKSPVEPLTAGPGSP